MELISCTEFVLGQEKKGLQNTDRHLRFERIIKYAKFLKQPLTLSMFIVCDDEGNVLEEPEFHEPNNESEIGEYDELIYKYQQAKERVVFEGYTVLQEKDYYIVVDSHGIKKWLSWNKSKTIESLINEITEVTITPNAVKTYQL